MTDLKKPNAAAAPSPADAKNTQPEESPKLNARELSIGVTKKVSKAIRDVAKNITASIDAKFTDYYKKSKGQEQKQEKKNSLKNR